MRKNTCVHFNGVQHACCKAGVSYQAFKGHEIPCIKVWQSKLKGSVPKVITTDAKCEKYTEPTPEQIAAYDAEVQASMKKFSLTFPLIKAVKTEHKGKSWAGVMECPVCKGRLHMSHASYNGHVHGRCETKDCVAWME